MFCYIKLYFIPNKSQEAKLHLDWLCYYGLLDLGLRRYIEESISLINCAIGVVFVM